MKKIVLIAALVLTPLAAMAAEQAVCTGTAGPSSTKINSTAGTDFIKVGFNPQCSAETIVSVDQNTTALWGASYSSKGKSYFVGSTNGGSIKPTKCDADPCKAADLTKGMAAAAAITGS